MKFLWIVLAAVLLAAPVAKSAEPQQAGSASKNDNLREKPFIDGKIIAAVKSGQSLAVQKREGSWYFVKTGARTGWLPMLSVRRTSPAAAAPKGATAPTGRSSTGAIVSTTGVRGLNEETLKTATFSDSAVASAEKFRVPSAAAEVTAFAVAGGITAQSVPSLAPPTATGGKK